MYFLDVLVEVIKVLIDFKVVIIKVVKGCVVINKGDLFFFVN